MKNWHYFLIAIGAVLVAPWLFTRPAMCDSLNFSETGSIGDTIGGITAPIVGIISILLLLRTLKAQLDFNKAQAKDNAISQILALQSEIIHADGKIEFTYQLNDKQNMARGCSSLPLLRNDSDYRPYIKLNQASFLLDQLGIVISLCKCYRSLVASKQETLKNAEPYIEFIVNYEKIMSDFLRGIEVEGISVRGGVKDIYSTEDIRSGLEDIKDRAKSLLTFMPIFEENDV